MHSKIHHYSSFSEDSCHESVEDDTLSADIIEDMKIVYWGDEIESHYIKFDEKE